MKTVWHWRSILGLLAVGIPLLIVIGALYEYLFGYLGVVLGALIGVLLGQIGTTLWMERWPLFDLE